ncbi:MAG: hypothetical protein JXR60_07290 [Bacteroidales bacterium]|nr:hypothetical protein [Bacteroidales bacterium]
MKIFIRFTLVLLGLCFSLLSVAQETGTAKDTLWYLNGDYELISDFQFVEDGQILNYVNHKGKHRDVEVYYIYKIVKSDGSTKILYAPSMQEEGDTLTVEEMGYFVNGGHKANTEYKAPLSTIEGFVVGAGSPFLVASVGLNPFISIIIPAANTTVVGVTSPRERKIIERYPELSKQPTFVEGYRQSAKRKRTKNSIKGSIVGLVAGITAVFIISAQ